MVKLKKTVKSVWRGPEVDGITQSLLSRYLVCKERFRLLVVEGLRPADTFNHRIEYGQMWHLCEEFAGNDWFAKLKEYATGLCRRYPLQQEQVLHWYRVCQTQFPIYVDYWVHHRETRKIIPVTEEQTFNVPYTLPSGHIVRLRGKWDGIETIGNEKNRGIYLVEHKTKSDIREEQIKRQMQFDLQTMFYLVALQADNQLTEPIKGVRYNVVRRPLSGGKGSIRQHKATKSKPAETDDAFYARLGIIIVEEPESFFMRWQVEVTQEDIARFKLEFLNPCLEELCLWWQCITNRAKPIGHYRMPFGIYNVLAEGGSSELDECLATGSTLGLDRVSELFPELK